MIAFVSSTGTARELALCHGATRQKADHCHARNKTLEDFHGLNVDGSLALRQGLREYKQNATAASSEARGFGSVSRPDLCSVFVLLMLWMRDQPSGTQARSDGETNENARDKAC